MVLALIVSLFLVAAFERHGTQRLIVKRQLAEYRRHHEMFGVRAIVRKWLDRSFDQLPQIYAEKGDRRGLEDFAYGFVLPSGATVRVFVADGQGALGLSEEGLTEPARTTQLDVLDRIDALFEGGAGLTRAVGPGPFSVNAAPRELLAALLDEAAGYDFADDVIQDRQRDRLDRERFDRLLERAGATPEEKVGVLGLVTFQPALWRLDILLADDEGERVFRMLTDKARGVLRIHEWYEVPVEGDGPSTLAALADPDRVRDALLGRPSGEERRGDRRDDRRERDRGNERGRRDSGRTDTGRGG